MALSQDNIIDISPKLKKTENIINEKPVYKAEFGVAPSVLSMLPSSTTIAGFAIGISIGLFAGFYFARK